MNRTSRSKRDLSGALVAIALTMVAAGCSGSQRAGNPLTQPPSSALPATADRGTTSTHGLTVTRTDQNSFSVEQTAASPRENGPEALLPSDVPDVPTEIRFTDPGFGPALVQSGDLQPGGPGPDGIPAINEPRFLRVADVDFLAEQEPVIVLALNGEVRAYPLQIMVWHEIVIDTVDAIPVAITYCPLCNSAFVFDRRHRGRVLSFGVSGALWNSSLVMFDRQTFSLWSQFTGQGLLGVFASDQLRGFPVTIASWSDVRDAHPNGIVLSRDTGFTKDYGRNPYPGYDDVNTPPFLFKGAVDGRFPAKTRVVGLDLDSGPRAVTNDLLRAQRVISLVDDDRPVVVWWQPGSRSALDARDVAGGSDVGATGVFDATIDGASLTFTALDEGFRDDQTSSTWNIFGLATSGPLAGRQLAAITHVDTFWFAWAAFRPDTTVSG
ncbi:MAG: DUF3179 domain-containing protein [Acidimicrobiales bacterium]